ncbi:hypothetical protein EYC84_005178 [Monilinia fructicola]|uniref:Mitochondrial carrier protein n=1 Tax=Monilinia fructicola TaxID=38448 RepID=A0A5M9K424_MONFR|nr:hypothetical protein EYC84_005178 [Monilinia fructicola]
MSPIAAVSPSSASKSYKSESTTARLLGSGSAGIAELAVFHPVDTIAKRLMSNQGSTKGKLAQVIFKDKATAPIGTNRKSCRNWRDCTPSLDVLKIKRQTNPEAFRGRGVVRIVKDEGFGLYRGWQWTAARNAPGSFALFGGSAFTKGYLFFGLNDYNKASWFQNFVASIAGASASLVVSAPLDVIKTRIQNRNFENPESGFRIVSSMMKNEGITSFFKGLTPKLLMTGPKLVFSFWLAQTLIPAFDLALSK